MSKLDVYLRSIEKFGATGAVLTSNQAVMLRFPTGDRHATQVTPHDQLVMLVREVAPPAALDQIDRQRPARFDYDSNGVRYAINVVPRQGAWQVGIDGAAPAPAQSPAEPSRPYTAVTNIRTPAPAAAPAELLIERGQYDAPAETARPTASGSAVLDELTRAARQARASDVYLIAGAQPVARVGSELLPIGNVLDGDTLSREVGVVAPANARGAWSEGGSAVFAYGDGGGRVRASLARDHRGPTATLRLLPDQVALDRLGLDIGDWLQRSGLIVIAGPAGAGKTVTLAALVGALAANRRVITIEDPIEIVQTSPAISQRELGTHLDSVAAGVEAALRENVDAIAFGHVGSPAAASAVIDAACGGGLVIACVVAPSGGLAVERMVEWAGVERREFVRGVVAHTLLGTILPTPSRSGRTFEVVRPGERRA
jgi:twitching motility protein PilT